MKTPRFFQHLLATGFLFLILLVSAISCKNDDNDALVDTVPDNVLPLTLQLPVSVIVTSLGSGDVLTLSISYNSNNQPSLIRTVGDTDDSITEITISYNDDGFITQIIENEIAPSPFSTELQFAYNEENVLTTLTNIIDGGTPNVFEAKFDTTNNSYTFMDGGEQVYTFNIRNQLISCTASGLPFLSFNYGAVNGGAFADVRQQVAVGITLAGINPLTAFGLYYFSSSQITSLTIFDTTGDITTLYDENGLVTGAEVSNDGITTARSEITYQTIEL